MHRIAEVRISPKQFFKPDDLGFVVLSQLYLILCLHRSLGQTYLRLCESRRTISNKCIEQKVAGFAPLVTALCKLDLRRPIAVVEAGTQAVLTAADGALHVLKGALDSLNVCQGLIRQSVSVFAQGSEGKETESLDELPEDIRRRIADRDLLCSKQADEYSALLRGLLETICQYRQGNISSMDRLADAEQLNWLTQSNMVTEMERRDAELEKVIESARECMKQYNIAIGAAGISALSRMGSSAKASLRCSGHDSLFGAALMAHDEWAKMYLGDGAARATDHAIMGLKVALTEDGCIASLLGLSQVPTQPDHESLLERTCEAADTSIANELKKQSSDAVSYFPCTLLLQAGRQVLEAWRGETEALKHACQVSQTLEAARLESKSLAGEGALALARQDALQALKRARDEHKAASLTLQMAALFQGKGEMARAMGFPAVPELNESRRRAQGAAEALRVATVKLTGELQGFFPEVILFIGQGLPAELGALWRPTQTLDAFDEKQLVAAASRHPVWRVREGNTWFAVKEYRLSRPGSLRTFLKEAAIIHRNRHHAIVELLGLFQDARSEGGTFYIQMPWYEHGTLDQWVVGGQLPEWYRVRAVLLDALQGLAHLHLGGVVHGDVKPANILVDARERGRLADFDVSIDAGQRTSAAWITSAATAATTARGFTAGFEAPELAAACRATPATDMFAFGRTVEAVQRQCEPPQDSEGAYPMEALSAVARRVADRARGQTAAFVQALTAAEPGRRPNAEDASKMAFFTVLEDVCRREARTCLLCELSGQSALHPAEGGGLVCAEGHFHCRGCLGRLTADLLEVGNVAKRKLREGQVMCCRYPAECRAPGFLDRELVALLQADVAQAYLGGRIEALQALDRAALEGQLRQELAEELRRLAVLDQRERRVVVARRHIEEEILQMRCPRAGCWRAFLDFDGCFAVSCSACPCKFCGWCLQDCGDVDAHPHCSSCPRVPPGMDALFPGAGAFEQAHRERCREGVAAYLLGLDEETRQGVCRALQPRLCELGLQ
jgi:serine/threonine protein kinase